MDPNLCLSRIIRSINDRDFEEATAALIDLAIWIEKGGFKPQEYRILLENLPRF